MLIELLSVFMNAKFRFYSQNAISEKMFSLTVNLIDDLVYHQLNSISLLAVIVFENQQGLLLSILARLYYQYIPEGKEYPLLCRRLETEKSGWLQTVFHNVRGGFGKEEILLDWNEIAEKYGEFCLGLWAYGIPLQLEFLLSRHSFFILPYWFLASVRAKLIICQCQCTSESHLSLTFVLDPLYCLLPHSFNPVLFSLRLILLGIIAFLGYVHVGTCRVSPDHNFLAYTIDTSGDEQFMLQIKDLRNQCIVPRLPVDGVVSLAWAQDSRTLFYTISDENQRPHRQILFCLTILLGGWECFLIPCI